METIEHVAHSRMLANLRVHDLARLGHHSHSEIWALRDTLLLVQVYMDTNEYRDRVMEWCKAVPSTGVPTVTCFQHAPNKCWLPSWGSRHPSEQEWWR